MTLDKALLDIDQASQLTGLPAATLRNWEKRYGFPRPERTEGGHRLYQVSEIRKLQEVVRLNNSGAKIKEAIQTVMNEGSEPNPVLSQAVHTPFPSLNEGLSNILQALYKFDLRNAEEQLSKMGFRLSEADLLEIVYPKLLAQIGDDWESSRISVAQEHFAWNFFRARLLNYFKTSRTNAPRMKVILATPEGELHEGGLMVLAAYMMLKDWEVYYLGADLPFADLKSASETIKPDLICLSAIRADAIKKNWKKLQEFICPVVIGGQCLSGLRSNHIENSKKIFLVDGGISSAISQLELLLHANQRL